MRSIAVLLPFHIHNL